VFGTVVSLLDLNTKEKTVYQLLGPGDADIDTGSISIQSPVGSAILGSSIGDKVSVTIPRGEFHFEVIEIAKSQIE
jgi:transcription elongation factor GreA